MFSRATGTSKAGLRAANLGDPINNGLVAWFPAGAIEKGGVTALNMIGTSKLRFRERDGWGGGGVTWYGGNSDASPTAGAWGGQLVSSDDYNTRPTFYFAELPRPKPTRAFTICVREPYQGGGLSLEALGGGTPFAAYIYGTNNLRLEMTVTGGFASYNCPVYPDKYGMSHFILSYDGATVRMMTNGGYYRETSATYTGDINYGTCTAIGITSRHFEDLRLWDRALGYSEMQRWINDGPTVGTLNAPSRYFQVISPPPPPAPPAFASSALIGGGAAANPIRGLVL